MAARCASRWRIAAFLSEPLFVEKILRQDRLGTTIVDPLDPYIPRFSRFSLRHLRKAQLWLQTSLHIKCTKHLLLQAFFHGPSENVRAMTLQNLVQPIDILEPLPGSAMYDLGEIANRWLSQLEQLLSFQIALAAFTGYCRHHGRAVLGAPPAC